MFMLFLQILTYWDTRKLGVPVAPSIILQVNVALHNRHDDAILIGSQVKPFVADSSIGWSATTFRWHPRKWMCMMFF